jgi:hypothetical protein
VAKRLRDGAARLDEAVDECKDWSHAPATGVFLLACDQGQLTRYVRNGLETPRDGGLRIDVASRLGVQPGPVTVPAVRRDPGATSMDSWWITAGHRTTADVYASCQSDRGMLEHTFREVKVTPRMALRVVTGQASADGAIPQWRLVSATGRQIGAAVVPRPVGTSAGSACGKTAPKCPYPQRPAAPPRPCVPIASPRHR